MADFSFDVSRWCDAMRDRANQTFRVIATDAVNRVKELTPVDTGFLRSNWTAVRNGDQQPVAGRVPPPEQAIQDLRVGDVLIILNPTVYARRIEYGFVGEDSLGRHYNQSGHHMVAQTMAELPAIADATIRRLNGR
jgi:hypothetical protein